MFEIGDGEAVAAEYVLRRCVLVGKILRVGAEGIFGADELRKLGGENQRAAVESDRVAGIDGDAIGTVLVLQRFYFCANVGEGAAPRNGFKIADVISARVLAALWRIQTIRGVVYLQEGEPPVTGKALRHRVFLVWVQFDHFAVIVDIRQQRTVRFTDSAEGGFSGHLSMTPGVDR